MKPDFKGVFCSLYNLVSFTWGDKMPDIVTIIFYIIILCALTSLFTAIILVYRNKSVSFTINQYAVASIFISSTLAILLFCYNLYSANNELTDVKT